MFKKLSAYISAIICEKIFEKLIFNEMFKFFIENELMSPNQSGFKPGDLANTHEINHEINHLIMDLNLEVFSRYIKSV